MPVREKICRVLMQRSPFLGIILVVERRRVGCRTKEGGLFLREAQASEGVKKRRMSSASEAETLRIVGGARRIVIEDCDAASSLLKKNPYKAGGGRQVEGPILLSP
jgi:hypothetical protein